MRLCDTDIERYLDDGIIALTLNRVMTKLMVQRSMFV